MTDEQPSGATTVDDVFDERNAFLDALLGLISLAERTLATAIDLAPPQAPPPPPSPAREPPTGRVLR
jgi:hypothetical protein